MKTQDEALDYLEAMFPRALSVAASEHTQRFTIPGFPQPPHRRCSVYVSLPGRAAADAVGETYNEACSLLLSKLVPVASQVLRPLPALELAPLSGEDAEVCVSIAPIEDAPVAA